MKKANLRLGSKGKQDQSEYDEVPLSQKSAATPNQRRGNFLGKLNPSFMNKFNDKDQMGLLREKDHGKKGPKFGGKAMGAEPTPGFSEANGGEDVSITVVSGKPPDVEYLLEIQRMAEEKYQAQQQEEEERYKGMSALEKRKKIIEDTKLLLAEEGKSGDKKASKGGKSAKEKKEGRSKPPKSQRPKWQNIIDDDEDDKKMEEDTLKLKDDQKKNAASTEKKRTKHQMPAMPSSILDSDERDEVNSQEDVQIIIKTDKHSQQRTNKRDIYESEYNNESRTEGMDHPQGNNTNPVFQSVNQSRDSHARDHEIE